jgi:hypothetical protein
MRHLREQARPWLFPQGRAHLPASAHIFLTQAGQRAAIAEIP